MTIAKTGLLALGLCIAILPTAYALSASDPLEQLRQGAEPREVSCSGDFALLVSPGGGPACVSAPTAAVLESREWERVLQQHADDEAAIGSERPWIMSAPQPPLAHPKTFIELSKYPVVGEIVDMTVITEYGDRPPENFGNDEYPIVKIDITSDEPDRYRVFDIVANIGTGDEDTFAPYDFETATVVADPEEVYILKAKLEILKEGVANVSMLGFDGDVLTEYVAASYKQSMSYGEYIKTGQTYLDALWAAGEAAAERIRERGVIYPDDPPESGPEDTRTAAEIERDWFTSLAQDYDEPEFTDLDVARAMLDLSYREEQVRDFLLEYMKYDLQRIEQIDMKSLLASLYKSYDWSDDEIIDDLLLRKYDPDDIRTFFADRLAYAPDQTKSLDIETVLSKHVDWSVVEILQRWEYAEDDIREFFVEYKGYTEEEAQAIVIGDPQTSDQEAESQLQPTTVQRPQSQRLDGIPLEAIRCNHSLVLVESPGADPACVTEPTAQKLADRGWTIVSQPDGRTIINSSDFAPPEHSAPSGYGWPTVIFDYPSQMKVGQEYSIYLNYTYSTVPRAYLLPDSFEVDVYTSFGDGIEVISEEFGPVHTRVHYGGTPYEYPIHRTAKLVDVDYEVWQQDEIRFRINKPVNGEGAVLSAKVGLTATARWLETDEYGTVTLLDEQPVADAAHGEGERRNFSVAINIPSDEPPLIDDALYEFLRDYVKPFEDVRKSLEVFPQEFIDEVFEKYPDLETQSHDSNAAGQAPSTEAQR